MPREMADTVYRRILLKLSGEALQGDQGFGISSSTLSSVVDQLVEASASGVQLGVVVGGGNFFRGIAGAASGMDRVRADQMGMLATCINAIAIEDVLLQRGVECRVLSAITLGGFAEVYTRATADRLLEQGAVVVFAAGTGSPMFSTDTAASLRAIEIGADALIKATKVDGVYDKDPVLHADARRFDRLTYEEVIRRRLRVMDLTAVTLCQEAGLQIRVLDLFGSGTIMRVLRGENVGTVVGG